MKPIPGRLVVFLVGQTCMNLEATDVVETKALKSAPAYPDVIPKQKIIKIEKKAMGVALQYLLSKKFKKREPV